MKNAKRRSSYFSIPGQLELERAPITIRGYDTDGRFVCRLEISSAGIAVYAGEKGKKLLRNVTWERLVQVLDEDN